MVPDSNMPSEVTYHPRLHRVDEAKSAYPDLLTALGPKFTVGDELADAAAEELADLSPAQREGRIVAALTGKPQGSAPALSRLVESTRELPIWLNPERCVRAGRVFHRAGALGGAVLGLKSLVCGYAAAGGNKPLALSGALIKKSDRRLAETGRFVSSVCQEDGMRFGRDGYRITLRVRLMHAQVRRLCLADDRYDVSRFGLPINQHDMLATILLFSNVFITGIVQLGVAVTDSEADDFQHLFRWVGQVIGVEPQLLPTSFAEAERILAFIALTEGPPDADSRALVRALLDGPLRHARSRLEKRMAPLQVALAEEVCRSLIGDDLADSLHVRRGSLLRPFPSHLGRLVTLLEVARRAHPGLERRVESWGAKYWALTTGRVLGDRPSGFQLPERLLGALQSAAK